VVMWAEALAPVDDRPLGEGSAPSPETSAVASLCAGQGPGVLESHGP